MYNRIPSWKLHFFFCLINLHCISQTATRCAILLLAQQRSKYYKQQGKRFSTDCPQFLLVMSLLVVMGMINRGLENLGQNNRQTTVITFLRAVKIAII